MHAPSVFIGTAAAIAARAALPLLLRRKLAHDIDRLNAGDPGPLLAGFTDDAVLHFNEGPHRWSGTHTGKAAITRFMRDFVTAGLQGRLGRVWVSGPPWALQLCARFDDRAHGPDGEQIYANRTIIWVRTRWFKIVEQRDYYEDTSRIAALEARLGDLGIAPVAP